MISIDSIYSTKETLRRAEVLNKNVRHGAACKIVSTPNNHSFMPLALFRRLPSHILSTLETSLISAKIRPKPESTISEAFIAGAA